IGEPDTTLDLAQRLGTTVAMLWSDVDGADLFLPQGNSGELRGLRDAAGSPALLGAVSVPYGADATVRVIPVTPTLVKADPGVPRGTCMSAPVVGTQAHGEIEGFIVVRRRPSATDFTQHDLDALSALARGVGDLLPRVRARGGRSV